MSLPAEDTVAVVLAGGRGSRLGALTAHECKPALPFGIGVRSIDFALSNCIHSGIRHIGVPTQYQPASLARHLAITWAPIAARHGAAIEEWPSGCVAPSGYVGTADAVHRNWSRIARLRPRFVLVLAGDHVYKMDYRRMIDHHVASGAGVTVGCIEVDIAAAHQFGILATATDGRIVRFAEKPTQPTALPDDPRRALASMGIYVFDAALLRRTLETDAGDAASTHDFGHDVIPRLITSARAVAYPFSRHDRIGAGYWRDIGTLPAYWQAQMDLLAPDSVLLRTHDDWPVLTLRVGLPIGAPDSRWPNAVIDPGCRIDAALIAHSVIYGGVKVGAHACIRNAVVLPGASIGCNSYVDGAIIAAGCQVPDNTVVGQPAILRADTTRAAGPPVLVTDEWLAARRRWERTREQAVALDPAGKDRRLAAS